MGMRDTLNNNPTVTTIGAILVLVLCLGLIVWQATGGDGGPTAEYFYDLNTGEVFASEPGSVPIEAPSGPTPEGQPAGVTARIFGCGSCKTGYLGMTADQIEQAGARLVYLQRPMNQPNRRPQGQNGGGQNRSASEPGPEDYVERLLVSRPGQISWTPAMSGRGQQITNVQLNCDSGVAIMPCYPDQ